jgi:hypothetical protein
MYYIEMNVKEWGKPTQRDEMPLQIQLSMKPFEKWGLYFVGPIDPPYPTKRNTYYFVQLLEKVGRSKVNEEC